MSSYYSLSVKLTDLNSHISLIAQVLSVLVGFTFVGATLYLSGYSVSEKISGLLNDIQKIENEIRNSYLKGPPKKSKITNHKFISILMNKTGINYLEFHNLNKKKLNYYIFRPSWDGVWYQIKNSPFF